MMSSDAQLVGARMQMERVVKWLSPGSDPIKDARRGIAILRGYLSNHIPDGEHEGQMAAWDVAVSGLVEVEVAVDRLEVKHATTET